MLRNGGIITVTDTEEGILYSIQNITRSIIDKNSDKNSNSEKNSNTSINTIPFYPLFWGTIGDSTIFAQGPYDVILAADVIYDPIALLNLIQTVVIYSTCTMKRDIYSRLSRSKSNNACGTLVIVSYEQRRQSLDHVWKQLLDAGFCLIEHVIYTSSTQQQMTLSFGRIIYQWKCKLH